MSVANWFKNIFKGKETLVAHGLESKVDIEFNYGGIDYFLVLMVVDKRPIKYVYYKEDGVIKEVELEDPNNYAISNIVDNAIEEFMKL